MFEWEFKWKKIDYQKVYAYKTVALTHSMR